MKRMTKGKFVPILLTAALGFGLVACGDDDSSTSTEAPASSEAPSTDAPMATDAPAEGATMANFTAWADIPDSGTESPVVDCTPEEGPLKAAWVYVGPTNDGGWTQTHDEGRLAAQEALGDAVETTYKENVPEGPQVVQTVEDLIADGNTVIFGTSYGFQDGFVELAAAHPNVCFEFATGYLSAPNLSQFYGAAEDTDYLAGMAAGAASATGKLAILASFPIPEVVRGVNAWTLGAQSVNPEATVKVVWLNTWFDPPAERKAAEALVAEGYEVLGMKGIDSPSTGDAALAAGIPWAGYNRDQSANYGDVWLTASSYHWEVYLTPRLQQILDGTWTAGNYYGNLSDGFVTMAPFGDLVSEETRALIEAKAEELAAATGSQFTGPIMDNQGNEALADGVSHTFGELMSMSYLVAGVDGEIPAS
ncbi:MAG: BMP family ABC transporter substrate-binding protein [Actinomycetota bacterium]|nr:BMP family ABC transporter substrate-binding protein [Actinomycetota bacterium]